VNRRELCVDVAGASTGGAARFRSELLGYVAANAETTVRVIGFSSSITAPWLVQREAVAGRSARLAVNNVSFVGPGRKTVLLRNALHFLRPAEQQDYLDKLPGMAAQTRIVHTACRRADLVVTPTNDMADRVCSVLPRLASRIEVRPHPLTFLASGSALSGLPELPFILSPALSAAHKDSATHLRRISAALTHLGRDELVVVTASGSDLPADLQGDPRIRPIGPQRVDDMPDWYARSSAIYFPTSVESFGYPLAEARVSGRPVIAIDSEQNREVAGGALCGYSESSDDAFEQAIAKALESSVRELMPDPAPFNPESYFNWLFARAVR
jgi:hypothetical protein